MNKTILFTLCLLSSVISPAVKYSKPQGYVSDFASVLDPSTRQSLESQLAEFERATTYEIAVVTVPSLEGDAIETYAVRLFQEWGIGKKGKDNGVLILVAPHERKVRIEVGYGLEPVLTDGMAGQIIRDHMLPAFRSGHYPRGIQAGWEAIRDTLTSGQLMPPPSQNTEKPNPGFLLILLIATIFLGVPFTLLILCLLYFISFRASDVVTGVAALIGIPGGLLLDMLLFRPFAQKLLGQSIYSDKWYRTGGNWVGGFGGGGGFGGFGGGSSGGGGASGGW